jgi:hypothetical protein
VQRPTSPDTRCSRTTPGRRRCRATACREAGRYWGSRGAAPAGPAAPGLPLALALALAPPPAEPAPLSPRAAESRCEAAHGLLRAMSCGQMSRRGLRARSTTGSGRQCAPAAWRRVVAVAVALARPRRSPEAWRGGGARRSREAWGLAWAPSQAHAEGHGRDGLTVATTSAAGGSHNSSTQCDSETTQPKRNKAGSKAGGDMAGAAAARQSARHRRNSRRSACPALALPCLTLPALPL